MTHHKTCSQGLLWAHLLSLFETIRNTLINIFSKMMADTITLKDIMLDVFAHFKKIILNNQHRQLAHTCFNLYHQSTTSTEPVKLQTNCKIFTLSPNIAAVLNVPYNAMLLNIFMSAIDRITTPQKMHRFFRTISAPPIITLTMHSLSRDKIRFIVTGMSNWLSNPIDCTTMLHCAGNTIAKESKLGSALPQKADKFPGNNVNKHMDPFINENVLEQLTHDISPEILPGLLIFYIEDARKRVEQIQNAIMNKDIEALEFESHALGSSAAAHSNTRLCALARKIECLCQEGAYQQALLEADSLLSIANESFRQLAERAKKF